MGQRDHRGSTQAQAIPMHPERQGGADLSLQVSEPGEAVLVICGTLDLAAVGQIASVVEAVLNCGCRRVLMDLTSGIVVEPEATRVWRSLADRMSYRGGAIALLVPVGQQCLEPLGRALGDALPVFTSKGRALRYLRHAFSLNVHWLRCLLAH